MGGKGNGDCVHSNFLLNEKEILSRTVEQLWAMESYGTVKSIRNISKRPSNIKTTGTLSEIYGKKISHHYRSTNH